MRWHSIGEYFGITAFGVDANEAPRDEEVIVRHSEMDYGGSEELYLVVKGRALFRCDGEEIEVAAGELLFVRPEVEREASALETPTVVFGVGAIPGKPYRHWTKSEGPGESKAV
jgi:mannose-6-phosphate isomerase-like protein (cupin superfamily)